MKSTAVMILNLNGRAKLQFEFEFVNYERQSLRSATSIGARGTCWSEQSRFLSKMSIASKKQESPTWLRLLRDSKAIGESEVEPLLKYLRIFQ